VDYFLLDGLGHPVIEASGPIIVNERRPKPVSQVTHLKYRSWA